MSHSINYCRYADTNAYTELPNGTSALETMKMQGELTWSRGIERNAKVKEVVLTSERVAIDWVEANEEWHLQATSNDGEHFSGNFGIRGINSQWEVELTLYRNTTETVLFGTWRERDSGDERTWFFKLSPEAGK
jgi:hypothetical protein